MKPSCTVFVVATYALTMTVACAQPGTEPPAESWEPPRTAAGKPDFSGFWSQPQHVEPREGGGATTFTKSELPPFVPGGEELFYKQRTGDPYLDEPRAFCM